MLINEIVSTCIIRYIYYSIQIINIINKDPPAPPRPVSPNYPRATPVPPHPHIYISPPHNATSSTLPHFRSSTPPTPPHPHTPTSCLHFVFMCGYISHQRHLWSTTFLNITMKCNGVTVKITPETRTVHRDSNNFKHQLLLMSAL